MTAKAIAPPLNSTTKEQYFVWPGCYSWQQFKALTTSLGEDSNVKISYLDGQIELMTTGEEHETISRLIALLLGLYFWHHQIEFIPVGSATRESEEKGGASLVAARRRRQGDRVAPARSQLWFSRSRRSRSVLRTCYSLGVGDWMNYPAS